MSKPLLDTTIDVIAGAVGLTLAMWVMGSTVPDTVPTTGVEIIDPIVTPPAIPVPVLDPHPETTTSVNVVCADYGPALPPPPTVCYAAQETPTP